MHSTETKNQFIELRAQGLSLDAISAQLDVPRSTLGRWHHESIEQIQRLRAVQWHLLEEQIGHRLEDSLQRIAQRIRRWEDVLDDRDPGYRNTLELVRLVRDTRREYLQLRSLLLAPLAPTRNRGACLTSLDPGKRDKMRQNHDPLDTSSLPANHLQQPEPAPSHSAFADFARTNQSSHDESNGERDCPGRSCRRLAENSPPPAASVPASEMTAPEIPEAVLCEVPFGGVLPLPREEGRGEGQTCTLSSSSPSPETRDDQPDEASSTAPVSTGAPATPIAPRKHKPYWLNGHYYDSPQYPEHVARASFSRAAK